MGKIIKDFNTTAEMQNYVRTAEGGKSYLLRDKSGEDGIGTTLTSGKRIVAYKKNYHDYLTFTAEQANSTVKGNLNHSTSIEYSYDGETWNNANNVTITLANIGDSVMYRGEANYIINSSSFTMTGKIAASGSIMSMLHKNPDDVVIDVNNAFYSMFLNCSSLTSAPELPATTLTNWCYANMFYGCTSLTTAPELPATTMKTQCYQYMFYNCPSINNVTIHATSWNDSQFDWLKGVASTGTIHNLGGATNIPTNSASGCPTGWTLAND